MDTMLLKAVDEPSMIRERRVDMTVVMMIVATGIDVRGLTCEGQIVSAGLRSSRVEMKLGYQIILPSQESCSLASLDRVQTTKTCGNMTLTGQHWQTAA